MCRLDNSLNYTRCKYFDPCYARATVVRARFLAAAFSDGSYLAHVNGAYLRHVTFCIVRGHPLFIVSPICQRGSRAAAHLTCRGTPASPILAVRGGGVTVIHIIIGMFNSNPMIPQ